MTIWPLPLSNLDKNWPIVLYCFNANTSCVCHLTLLIPSMFRNGDQGKFLPPPLSRNRHHFRKRRLDAFLFIVIHHPGEQATWRLRCQTISISRSNIMQPFVPQKLLVYFYKLRGTNWKGRERNLWTEQAWDPRRKCSVLWSRRLYFLYGAQGKVFLLFFSWFFFVFF